MSKRWWAIVVLGCIGGVLLAFAIRPWFIETNVSALVSPPGVSQINVPPGFVTNLYARGLNGPRFIHFGLKLIY